MLVIAAVASLDRAVARVRGGAYFSMHCFFFDRLYLQPSVFLHLPFLSPAHASVSSPVDLHCFFFLYSQPSVFLHLLFLCAAPRRPKTGRCRRSRRASARRR